MSDMVEVTVTVRLETERALCVSDGGREQWLPKSQIASAIEDGDYQRGQEVTIMLPEWLAFKKGLI